MLKKKIINFVDINTKEMLKKCWNFCFNSSPKEGYEPTTRMGLLAKEIGEIVLKENIEYMENLKTQKKKEEEERLTKLQNQDPIIKI